VLLALADEVIEVSINFARTLLHLLTAAYDAVDGSSTGT
jgi:hypothetical protein